MIMKQRVKNEQIKRKQTCSVCLALCIEKKYWEEK